VVAADLILDSLASTLQDQKLTDSTQVVIFDEKGTVLVYVDNQLMLDLQLKLLNRSINVLDLGSDELSELYNVAQHKISGIESIISTEQGKWFSIVTDLSAHPKRRAYLAIATPISELTANARAMARENLIIAGCVILLSIFLGLVVTRHISSSLHTLDQQAERIREFDFDTPINVKSRIKEVTNLATSMTVMKSVIQRFIEIARSLSAEQKMEPVLELILQDAMAVTNADGGSIALLSDDNSQLEYVLIRNENTGMHIGGTSETPINLKPVSINEGDSIQAELHVLQKKCAISFDNIDKCEELDFSKVRERHQSGDYKCESYLALPLLNRQKDVIGVLQLVNSRDRQKGIIKGFSQAYQAYVFALASNASLALDNNRLIRAQKDLFDAFVQLIAGAIDTKSPYTGGHCQRVPVLAELLASEASRSKREAFRDFSLSEEDAYELYVASWLHDCGKVTTPEYVVDKATKLETLYNRIHEIRMRFEVLWRDAEIAYRDGLADDPGDKEKLRNQLNAHHLQLQEDFAFLASCNAGAEYMDPDHIQRVKEIASQTWQRHFDDRIGLSEDEMQLRKAVPTVSIPADEQLLADRPEHLIPRTDGGNPFGENPYAFKMDVPDYAFNLGEITNLCIAAGTLTNEDRFKINDHIVQTIKMLNKLPFPKTLKRVPEWAGNHHEKLDGTGYPRKLNANDLSIPERVMAIADIFEALTASDRPYKKAKTLNESVRILSFMRNDGHICPDLFDLFLTSGIYLKYAEEYLSAEQIDEVDINVYVSNDRDELTGDN
jgi:HD-GYP domain-containing protein (c-di-GMP phosphodiesterase class II)